MFSEMFFLYSEIFLIKINDEFFGLSIITMVCTQSANGLLNHFTESGKNHEPHQVGYMVDVHPK